MYALSSLSKISIKIVGRLNVTERKCELQLERKIDTEEIVKHEQSLYLLLYMLYQNMA